LSQSTKRTDRGIVTAAGVLSVREYDRVGEFRLMEHLVLTEAANTHRGLSAEHNPIPTDVRRTVIEPLP
jgi:hypothetical protein